MAASRATEPGCNIRAVGRRDWAAIESLFGPNGAAGGCWCQWWRVEKGGKAWEACKGGPNRAALQTQLAGGALQAVIARRGRRPVGWCSVGPRGDFPRLERSRMARAHGRAGAGAIVCIFVTRGERGAGIGRALVEAATSLSFARGASEVQAYPVPLRGGVRSVDVFAWTGVPAMFPATAGWKRIDDGSGRPALRLRPTIPSARATAP